MISIIRRWTPMALWLAACTAAIAALWSVDEPRFDLPPVEYGSWSQWASGREVLDVAAGVSRLLATVALGYLLAASVAHLLALLFGPAGLRRITARLNPGPVAALAATAVLGGSPLAAALTVGGPVGAGTADDPETTEQPAPVMRVIGEDADPTTTTTTRKASSTSIPTTTEPPTAAPRVEPLVPPSPTTGPNSDENTTSPLQPAPGNAASGSQEITYTVVGGDHLWSIAERWVHLGFGREGTEAEVRSRWLALMELNAPRMVEPGNPNLLFPGQEILLPVEAVRDQ